MQKAKWISLILAVSLLHASSLLGNECVKCHSASGVQESKPAVAPIMIKMNGITRRISLSDAFGFHGHSCPGVTVTFRALQYGILLLYGKEIPEREDLVVFSKTPTSGSLDMLDLLMIGEKRTKRTPVPEGMKSGRDTFHYTLYRKSTHTAVDIHLKPDHFPGDFFELKKKQKSKTLTSEEWDRLHGYMRDMILTFPTMSFEALFDRPKPYKTIVWGELSPAD